MSKPVSENKTTMTPAQVKINHALERLLQKRNLDDIYVSDLIEDAGISRKTFYRHYKDKYDLANQYFSAFFAETFAKITFGKDWESALLEYLEICEDKAAILKHAYSSYDINGLRAYDIDLTRKTYEAFLLSKNADLNLPVMKFAIEIAARGGTEMIIEWLKNGMQEDKNTLIMFLKRTLPQDILYFVE